MRRLTKVVLTRVTWLAKGASLFWGSVLTVAVVLGAGTTALAAVPGDPFKLGQTNVVGAISRLVGNVAGPTLFLDNNSSASGARALDLRVEPGKAPMTVNATAGKAAGLDADELDGKDSSAFLPDDVYMVVDQGFGSGDGFVVTKSARCDPGDRVLGGGGGTAGGEAPVFSAAFSDSFSGVDSWAVQVRDNAPASFVIARALCADLPPLR